MMSCSAGKIFMIFAHTVDLKRTGSSSVRLVFPGKRGPNGTSGLVASLSGEVLTRHNAGVHFSVCKHIGFLTSFFMLIIAIYIFSDSMLLSLMGTTCLNLYYIFSASFDLLHQYTAADSLYVKT